MSVTRTREEVLEMHTAYQRGDTLAAIAKREGVTRQRIAQLFEEHHLYLRPRGASSTRRRLAQEAQAHQERDRIIDLYKEYGTLDSVVKRIELPRRLVSEIVDEIPNREMYRRRGRYVTRSRESLILDIQKAANLHPEKTLTIPAYRAAARELGLASLSTQVKRFGSFLDALKASGVKGNEPVGPRNGSITPQDCITAVARCWRELDRRPSYDLYREWAQGKDVPSAPTVRQKLRTWNVAVQSALDLL